MVEASAAAELADGEVASVAGSTYGGDGMSAGTAGNSAAGAGRRMSCVVVDGLVIGSMLRAAGAAGSVVCADTKPTARTIVAAEIAAIAAIGVLDAFIADLRETLVKRESRSPKPADPVL